MPWETFVQPRPCFGHSSKRRDYQMRIAAHKHKAGRSVLCVTLTKSLLKRLKWKNGDRVEFVHDGVNGWFGLRRTVKESGYLITNSSIKKSGDCLVKTHMAESQFSTVMNDKKPRSFYLDDLLIDDDDDVVAFETVK